MAPAEPLSPAHRALIDLFGRLRAAQNAARARQRLKPLTNGQLAQSVSESRARYQQPPQRPADSRVSEVLPDLPDEAAKRAAAGEPPKRPRLPGADLAFHLAFALGGQYDDARQAYALVERAVRERAAGRGRAIARTRAPDAVVEAVLTVLDDGKPVLVNGKPGLGDGKAGQPRAPRLAAAIEIALRRAVEQYARSKGKASLAVPLFDPSGFLAEPEVAEILARAMTGGYLKGAGPLGRAWAAAFLDGTRTDDLTQDAEELLGYLWDHARALRPLAEKAPDQDGARGLPRAMTVAELDRELARARERTAGLGRVAAAGVGESTRRLPPGLRSFLEDQTHVVADATRDFVGRATVLEGVRRFINGDADGYCFILAPLGVGKTALLAHLVTGNPAYVRHFNVRSEGVFTAERFLNNVCAQLIGGYRLDPGQFPERGDATPGLLRRLLKQAAAAEPGGKVVVLLDALDEADTDRRGAGVNPLTLPRSLPEGCRFIVTVREGTEGWEPVLAAGCAAERILIERQGQDNLRDAYGYILRRSQSEGVERYLRAWDRTPQEFAAQLAERSEGYFVYLRHALDSYDAGGYLAGKDPETLPAGLQPYYQDQYERMRADTPAPEWDKVRLPVLVQLAIAERPLTLDQLASRVRLREIGPVASAIEQWRPFLVRNDELRNGRTVPTYRLFHESFREFLRTQKSAAEVAEAQRALNAEYDRRARDKYGIGRPPRPGDEGADNG